MNRNQAINTAAGFTSDRRVRRGLGAVGLKGRLLTLIFAVIGAGLMFNLALLHRFEGVVADAVDNVSMHYHSHSGSAAPAVDAGLRGRVQRFQQRALALAALVAALAATAAVLVTARLLKPLAHLRETTQRIAAGQLDQSVPVRGTDDIGTIGALVNDMAANQQEILLHMWNQTHHSLVLLERIGRGVADAARNDGLGAVKADVGAVKKSMENLQALMDGVQLYKVRIDGARLDSGPSRR